MFEVEGLRGHYLLAFGCWSFGGLLAWKLGFWRAALGQAVCNKSKEWATLECSLPTMPKSVASETPDRFNVWC
jgi:hypothetical protein